MAEEIKENNLELISRLSSLKLRNLDESESIKNWETIFRIFMAKYNKFKMEFI